MLKLEVGDCVFAHFNSSIRAVGIVMAKARTCPRPDFKFANQFWNEDGWLVDVEFRELTVPFDPKSMLEEYQLLGPAMHGPINSKGRANMEYLYEVPENLGFLYQTACAIDLRDVELEGADDRRTDSLNDMSDEEVTRIKARTDIGPTERRALTLARRGQGFYKKEVAHFEKGCRLTGVTDLRHLRASHIKPWSQCDDLERLDGANGLLLSPHIDHLFDRGYISFTKGGDILRSPTLTADVIGRWSLRLDDDVGRFTKRQELFLEFHRETIFQN